MVVVDEEEKELEDAYQDALHTTDISQEVEDMEILTQNDIPVQAYLE